MNSNQVLELTPGNIAALRGASRGLSGWRNSAQTLYVFNKMNPDKKIKPIEILILVLIVMALAMKVNTAMDGKLVVIISNLVPGLTPGIIEVIFIAVFPIAIIIFFAGKKKN